jgi:hypothetical protein
VSRADSRIAEQESALAEQGDRLPMPGRLTATADYLPDDLSDQHRGEVAAGRAGARPGEAGPPIEPMPATPRLTSGCRGAPVDSSRPAWGESP